MRDVDAEGKQIAVGGRACHGKRRGERAVSAALAKASGISRIRRIYIVELMTEWRAQAVGSLTGIVGSVEIFRASIIAKLRFVLRHTYLDMLPPAKRVTISPGPTITYEAEDKEEREEPERAQLQSRPGKFSSIVTVSQIGFGSKVAAKRIVC